MTYDAWKTRSPDDGYYDPDYDDDYDLGDDCDHTDDYEIDLIDGVCRCHCGHRWLASAEEINAECERQSRFYEDMDREMRKDWWRDQFRKLAFWRWRWKPKPVSDDEIPF